MGSGRFEDFVSTFVAFDVLFSSCLSWESRLTVLLLPSADRPCPALEAPLGCDAVP
jgi:hypothetical protein